MNESPIFTGMGGQVWEVKEALRIARERNPGKPDATVGMWLVNCPQAHPLWSHYLMILIHLRPVEGITGLKIYLEGASHETWLYAMHPDWKPSLSGVIDLRKPNKTPVGRSLNDRSCIVWNAR